MINKNLRSILYYVIGVTMVCLMIELSKRVPQAALDPALYDVNTAKESQLATLPNTGSEDAESLDVIPKRNRGRVKVEKKPKKMAVKSEQQQEEDNIVRDTRTDKEKF